MDDANATGKEYISFGNPSSDYFFLREQKKEYGGVTALVGGAIFNSHSFEDDEVHPRDVVHHMMVATSLEN